MYHEMFGGASCTSEDGINWTRDDVPLERGDRVRIKEGYDGAGDVALYISKSAREEHGVLLDVLDDTGAVHHAECLLAEAIEAYPYSREERIERAMEDYTFLCSGTLQLGYVPDDEYDESQNALYAILDAGVDY